MECDTYRFLAEAYLDDKFSSKEDHGLVQFSPGTRQGHPTRNFDEISVRESLPVLRLSDNALPKSY